MIDETTQELLSRALDDDLGPQELERLEARLAREPELSERLVALRRLRAEVARLAASESPPATLDRLVEPLRRSRAPRRQVRPVFGWLAAAASIVVVATLSLEVARRSAAPSAVALRAEPAAAKADTPAPSPGSSRYFQLAPLPQPADPEAVPQGAAERLLREGPRAPAADPPPALEVVGPLEAPPPGAEPANEEKAEEEAAAAAGEPEVDEEYRARSNARTGRQDRTTALLSGAEATAGGRIPEGLDGGVGAEVEVAGRRLRISVPEGVILRDDAVLLEVVLRSQRIVAVHGVAEAGVVVPVEGWLIDSLWGLEIAGLADGTYPAVVERAEVPDPERPLGQP